MGAFERNDTVNLSAESKYSSEECIIAQKVFDQCRIRKCLTPAVLGPARVAFNTPAGNEMLCEGDIIVPPCNATSVSIRHLSLDKIEVLSKKRSPLRRGCWEVELKYVFIYELEFRRSDGAVIACITATSSYTLQVTLFGASESDVTVGTDLYSHCANTQGGPFVSAEGTAVVLQADLKYPCNPCFNPCFTPCNPCAPVNPCGPINPCDPCGNVGGANTGYYDDPGMNAPIAVDVTIGLFTVVKMFRTVNLLVNSCGNCFPEECYCPTNTTDPCDFFDKLDFPSELFAPTEAPRSCCVAGGGCCSGPIDDDCGCDNKPNRNPWGNFCK